MKEKIQIIFTDLDGTLLNRDKKISRVNYARLEELGRHKVVRVIATGRSLYSFRCLFPDQVPADYLIFSTGAGIVDLNTKELIYSANIGKHDIRKISSYLQEQQADFMVHHTVPDNHRFFYWGDVLSNSDFKRRIDLYRVYAQEFTSLESLPESSAQIIAIFSEDPVQFNLVKVGLGDYQITRTTSPLDGKSIWMEILPSHVGKGAAAAWLCSRLKLDRRFSVGIGNDYNDLSLLQFTEHSFVVAEAPQEMLENFPATCSHDDDGFHHAIRIVLEL
ncbi:HAD family hydrolase [Desulfopila inferna]|uniref:HAD family hydrolase n=1 Tax=Desulfopila inferna TaxID=468528 RepID=UPI001966937E|nr:HAD family hydrolase [Desulfopila inferna]MBM9605678.1 HAD family phosphatase [Desulfopila inferna]